MEEPSRVTNVMEAPDEVTNVMEGPSRVIKRRWRETIQSLYDDHVVQERDQQLKQTKLEIESKLPKILKLAKDKRNNRRNRNNHNNSEGNSKKDSELVEFIQDFQKQYQTIYDLYDSVRGQLTQTYNSINKEDGYFTATSSSDSESDSSASLAIDAPTLFNGNLRSVKHELEAKGQQVAELKQQVTFLTNEKEAMNSEYLDALSKLEGAEKFLQELKVEHEELKVRLDEKKREVLSLTEMQKKSQGEASALIKDWEERVKNETMTAKRLQTQNSELHAQVQSLLEKKTSKNKEKYPSTTPVDSENNSSSEQTTRENLLLVGVNNQLSSLHSQQKTQHNSYKASLLSGGRQLQQVDDQVSSLMRELESMRKWNSELESEMKLMQKQNSQLESEIKTKTKESSEYLMQIENLRKESASKAATECDMQTLKEEKEHMATQIRDLELQIQTLLKEKTELEEQKELARKAATEYDHQVLKEEKELIVAQIRDLELQIQSLLEEKTKLEEQKESRDRENRQLTNELDELKGKTSKLEATIRERGDQFVSLQKRLEEGEDEKSAEIISLTAQINQLSGEKDSLQERILQLEKNLKDRGDDYSVLEGQMSSKILALSSELSAEKESLQERISQLEKKLKDREGEYSDLEGQMSSKILASGSEVNLLKKELDIKCELEENIRFQGGEISHLKEKRESLQGKIKDLDEKIKSQDSEISQLKEERESLQVKIKELEHSLTEKEEAISVLQTEHEAAEKETSCRQINDLEEVDDQKKGEESRLKEMENENMELRSKIEDQEAVLKQQEETINRLNEDCKKVKGRFLQAADRKMDELAEEFRKNFEDKLRILSQRIRVAEQLHTENKESYKQMKEFCEQEHSGVAQKLSQYSGLISLSKTELNKILEATNEMLGGLEALIMRKLGDEEGNFMQRLSKISDELQITKDWVRWTINEIKPPGGNGGSQVGTTSTDEKEQEDKVMSERVRELEGKLSMEKGDKMKLMRGMYELQKRAAELERAIKEKDEGLMKLCEEKVEAIRQLCIGIDYHRTRFDSLKQIVMMNRRSRSR